MSNLSDVAGTVEDNGKGRTPKECFSCREVLGHIVNNYMTVILRWMESYHGFLCRKQGFLQISESLSRLIQSAFLCVPTQTVVKEEG